MRDLVQQDIQQETCPTMRRCFPHDDKKFDTPADFALKLLAAKQTRNAMKAKFMGK